MNRGIIIIWPGHNDFKETIKEELISHEFNIMIIKN